MLMPLADIDNTAWRLIDEPRIRYPGWVWLGCIVFGIAVWTAVGFGISALIKVL